MRHHHRLAAALAFLLATVIASQPVTATSLARVAQVASRVPVTSLAEERWERVIPQQYDFSCGSAAVATLLTYHYGIPTTEEEVFRTMFRQGDQQRIRAQGFSLLDMKRYLDSLGLNAGGFRMTVDDIARIGVPVIVLVNTGGYRHFVVVKGVRDGEVLAGDPAGGAAIVSRELFENIWTGIALGARDRIEVARSNFNDPADWALRPQAPIGRAVNRTGLGLYTLTLPGRSEFGR